jgi:hypothetical protein
VSAVPAANDTFFPITDAERSAGATLPGYQKHQVIGQKNHPANQVFPSHGIRISDVSDTSFSFTLYSYKEKSYHLQTPA